MTESVEIFQYCSPQRRNYHLRGYGGLQCLNLKRNSSENAGLIEIEVDDTFLEYYKGA